MSKTYDLTLIATAKIYVTVPDDQDGFDALRKAQEQMIGKEILIADPDGDPNYPLQSVSNSGAVKVENIIIGSYEP